MTDRQCPTCGETGRMKVVSDPVWSKGLTTYVCALRGDLSGLEGGIYAEDIEAFNIEAAVGIFYAKHTRWPTDVCLKGSNLDYTRKLETERAQLHAVYLWQIEQGERIDQERTQDAARIAALESQLSEAKGDAEHWHKMYMGGNE